MNKPSIKKNYVYQVLFRIISMIIPVITIPYLSRVLGPLNIGIFSYLNSISVYFILLGSLGTELYGIREIAYKQNNKYERSKVFYEIFIVRVISISISLILFYALFCINNEYSVLNKILLIEILSNIFDITWFYQGLEDFKKIFVRNLLIKLISLVCIFTLVQSSNDLSIYMIIYCLSIVLGNVMLWRDIDKYLEKVRLRELDIKRHLKPIMILFIPQVAVQIYMVLDKTMLGYLISDKSEVGYYEQAQKITRFLFYLIASLSAVIMPRVSLEYAKGNIEKVKEYLYKSFDYVFMMVVPMSLGDVCVSNVFVPIFLGNDYMKSIPILNILSITNIIIAISNLIGSQYLLPLNRNKEYTIACVSGAVVNIVFNWLLIPKYQAIGACMGTIIAESVVSILQLFYVRKEIDIKNILKMLLKYLAFSLVMCLINVGLSRYLESNVLGLMIEILISMGVYFGMIYVYKKSAREI